MAKKIKFYRTCVDTSVFGGTEDKEFLEPSRKFFEKDHAGDFVVLVSEMLTFE